MFNKYNPLSLLFFNDHTVANSFYPQYFYAQNSPVSYPLPNH